MSYMLSIKRVLGDDEHPRGPYVLVKHYTSPEQQGRSCIGLPRKYAPPTVSAEPEPEPAPFIPTNREERAIRPNKDTGLYGVRLTKKGRYHVTFTAGLRTHNGGLYDDWRSAGMAHDDYVVDQGLARPLNFPQEREQAG